MSDLSIDAYLAQPHNRDMTTRRAPSLETAMSEPMSRHDDEMSELTEITGECVHCHDTHTVTELFIDENGQIVCGDHLVIPQDCRECGAYLETDNLEQIDAGMCPRCISRDYHESSAFDRFYNR